MNKREWATAEDIAELDAELAAKKKANSKKRKAARGSDDCRKTQSTILIGIACEGAEFFHTADGAAFADIRVAGHRETWPVKSRGFRRWLDGRFYEKLQSAANSDAKQAALSVLEAKAHFDAPEREVYLRCGARGCSSSRSPT